MQKARGNLEKDLLVAFIDFVIGMNYNTICDQFFE